MKLTKLTKLFLIAASLAAAATGQDATAKASARKMASVTSKTSPAASWVVLNALTDRRRYTPGQPISVRLAATNTSKYGAYLRFTSGQRFDFSIVREDTKETVYTWSATRMFIRSLGSLWLKPGQTQNYEANIGDEMGQLQPGGYRLVARLANSPRPIIAAPVRFEVVNLGLVMTARTDRTAYKVAEPVQIGVRVANRAGRENRVTFDSGLTFDVIVSDEAGKPVWTYGANLRFIRVLGSVTWTQGEVKEYTAEWNGVPLPGESGGATLKPGRYKVQAVLQSTPLLYAAPVYIDIQ